MFDSWDNRQNNRLLCVYTQVVLGGATSLMCMAEDYYPAHFCNATMVILQVGVTDQRMQQTSVDVNDVGDILMSIR
jgi:hypothetical protein